MNTNNFVSSEIQSNSKLTPEKLRTYKGFENISDEEAIQQIEIINSFVRILRGIYVKQNSINKSE